MFINSILMPDNTARMLIKAMDLSSLQAEVVGSNLANIDTPGYKAREIDFREALSRFSSQESSAAKAITLERTHSGHMSIGGRKDGVKIELNEDGPSRVDGNTVDMDAQLMNLAEIQLMNNFAITAYSKKMGMVSYAIMNSRS